MRSGVRYIMPAVNYIRQSLQFGKRWPGLEVYRLEPEEGGEEVCHAQAAEQLSIQQPSVLLGCLGRINTQFATTDSVLTDAKDGEYRVWLETSGPVLLQGQTERKYRIPYARFP